MRRIILACFACLLLIPSVSASTIVNPSVIEVNHLIPFLIALGSAFFLWKWMVPSQLSALQVGFEIDDGLYEVHRLTKGRRAANKLLSLPNVGFGVVLYMMSMTGVLLLIAELVFNPSVYYWPNILLMGAMAIIPILISPWETLNGQLIGRKSANTRPRKTRILLRRLGTLAALVGASLASYLFLLPRVDEAQKPIVFAVALLVFMSPTILAYGRIMGASWNMLMIGKFRSWLGKENPIDPEKHG